uniref:Uncharacterized protein n=1 Tax=Rousettus aegyptiacus TaxID=9407 RepID=A0A7J8HS30_ROUAE|nr:hypothetical protein HJG63_013093 [Rousettus aegyptiacus]
MGWFLAIMRGSFWDPRGRAGVGPALTARITAWAWPGTPALLSLRVHHCPLPSSSRAFSSRTTVMKPVPPSLFQALEKASGEEKKVMRRTHECERGKKKDAVAAL